MHRGFIKLWRKSTDHGLLQNPNTFTLWCFLLLRASHKPYQQVVGNQVVDLLPGQVVVGRKALAKELGQTEAKIRRGLKLLETLGNVTISRTNKFSVLSVVNWGTYQNQDGANDQQVDQQAANKRPTDDQQAATNKNEENKKNEKKPPAGAFNRSLFPESLCDADVAKLMDAWALWYEYKREQRKTLTKSTATSQMKKLAQEAPDVAVAMIEQSIANGWIGLFELKGGGQQATIGGNTLTCVDCGKTIPFNRAMKNCKECRGALK